MSGDREYDSGVCDMAELARLLVEVERAEGGDLGSLRRRVETLWLQFGHASSEIINDERATVTIKNSKAAKRLRDSEAAVEQARTGLRRVEGQVQVWQQAVEDAGRQVTVAQCSLLREAASELRRLAESKRAEADHVGDATEDVPVTAFSPAMGSRTTLVRQRVGDRLAAEAVSIDARADQLVAMADGFERAVRELAELEREQPLDDARVARRRAGIDGLRAGLANQVQRILEED